MNLIFPVLILIFSLLQNSNSVAKSIITFIYIIAIVWYLIVDNKITVGSVTKIIKVNKAFLFLLVLACISVIRTNNDSYAILPKLLNYIILLTLLLLMTYSITNTKQYNSTKYVINFIIVPFGVLCLINFTLWVLGVSLQEDVLEGDFSQSAMLLSRLGIEMDRIQFPLTGGFNSYGSSIGGIFTITLITFFVVKKKTLFLGMMIASFFLTLLLIDTRSALFYPIVILGLILFLKSQNKYIPSFKYLILLLLFGPVIFSTVTFAMSNLDIFQTIARSQDDLHSGNARTIIWGMSTNEFLNFRPIHLIGFGEYGQKGSGVSSNWSYIFEGWKNSELTSPHNTSFSILFDCGYIGLITYIILHIQLISRLKYIYNHDRPIAYIYGGFVLYNLLTGITETLNGFYFFHYFVLFCLVTVSINSVYYRIYNDIERKNSQIRRPEFSLSGEEVKV
ncbi:O-antigen ligase family protein [Larkinella rosea]|uniref:O-antigen ligase domain-containing protein n=1 Tax=Larkinella rosea TaxID=2025312 RepID=A0A3P1BSY9_9BACT|nr:O-antigen ligase domain-containing protein [Larkinella rosea]